MSDSASMQAWQITGPGSFDRTLCLVHDAARPVAAELKPGQVLVKVVSVGLNPADYKVPELGLPARAVFSFPKTPGMDLAGFIEAMGEGVEDVKVGDVVMGRLDGLKAPGTLAEYAVVDAGCWAPCAGIDMNQAAGSMTTALTAYQCIAPYVKHGDKVFINGGGGGLGTAGIQIAKLLGCHVTVSCSTAKLQFCKDLGADEVIDYKTEDITERLVKHGADKAVIVDNVGNSPTDLYRRCDQILRPSAPYMFVGGRVSMWSAVNLASSLLRPTWLGGQKHKFVVMMTKTVEEQVRQIASWMAEGKLRTLVDSTFAFGETKEAFDKLKTDKCSGKVIVRVSGEKKA